MYLDETTIIIDTDTKKEAGPLNVSELSPTSDLDKYYVYKCKNGCCKIIIGHNIINISTMKIIDVTDGNLTSNSVTDIINSIIIMNCKDNSCKRTYGYFKTSKTNDIKYYSIPWTGFNNNKPMDANDFSIDCNDSDIGKIKNNGDFCQGSYIIENAMSIKGDTNPFYIISSDGETIFHGRETEKSLVISATTNTLIYDGLSKNKGLKVFNKGIMTSDIMDGGNNIALYYCGDQGICRSLDGYITDGTNYYEVNGISSTSKLVSSSGEIIPNNECIIDTSGNLVLGDTTNLNKLKFCLGNMSIDFLGTETTEYYIIHKHGNTNYSLVRATKNIFTIEELKNSGKLK